MLISETKPWLKNYPKSGIDHVMKEQTIYSRFKETVAAYPESKAMFYFGRVIRYSEMLSIIDELANAYYGLGVREGELVSYLMPTTPESIFSLYALNKIGAIPNFIDPRMDTGRILDALKGTESKIFVTIDLAFPKVKKIQDKLNAEKIVISSPTYTLPKAKKFLKKLLSKRLNINYSDKIIDWKTLLSFAKDVDAKEVEYKKDSLAAITYTGGTTGTPKGVMLKNDGLNTMAESMIYSGVDQNIGDKFLGIMPIFSSYGVGCGVHLPFSAGWELQVFPKFTPARLGKLVKKYRPNHMIAVPSFYEQMMNSHYLKHTKLDFLRSTGCGGDTMNAGLEEQFNAFLKRHKAKYSLCQGYGMSELSSAATFCFSNIYKDGSVGIPLLSTTVGIFDPDTCEELGYGVQGEICMTGRNMMMGYYNKPEETDIVMRKHQDGLTWVHSGDIGYMDEDGFVFVKGRIKQIIIKFDGHKVFPVSIESILNKHPSVAECAVVGIPDPNHAQGEVPLGVVELKGDLAEDIDKEALRLELLKLCDKELEERGKPADVVFIPQMVYTGLNKHDYKKLGDMYRNHVIKKH